MLIAISYLKFKRLTTIQSGSNWHVGMIHFFYASLCSSQLSFQNFLSEPVHSIAYFRSSKSFQNHVILWISYVFAWNFLLFRHPKWTGFQFTLILLFYARWIVNSERFLSVSVDTPFDVLSKIDNFRFIISFCVEIIIDLLMAIMLVNRMLQI